MFASVSSAIMQGLSVVPIQVEADVRNGLPGLHLIGHLSSDVREAGERVRTALYNSNIVLPPKRITINLAPADVRKSGSLFDLPIAVAISAASGFVKWERIRETMFFGEIGLDGTVAPVRGILSMTRYAKEQGFRRCIVPIENQNEAELVEGIEVVGVSALPDVFRFLSNGTMPDSRKHTSAKRKSTDSDSGTQEVKNGSYQSVEQEDFLDLVGQESLKRVCLIAAAGFHNLLLTGPPGVGKTMAAKRIPGIMPPLTIEESFQLTEIYSLVGELRPDAPLVRKRPFRAPHHTITPAGLIGGGAVPLPGEMTKANGGVLFLDEFSEFKRSVLEILRLPLEEHEIALSRNKTAYRYPADFLLIAAMNPCPCGLFPSDRCTCTSSEIHRYQSKISKPLLDRIDVFFTMESLSPSQILHSDVANAVSLSSEEMAAQVERAVACQKHRFSDTTFSWNSRIPAAQLNRYCRIDRETKSIVEMAFEKLHLSMRGYHRSLRVARTIADLSGSEQIEKEHFLEAIGYRHVTV